MKPRILITGASSGLGAALARYHAAQGAALLLLARRAPLLRELERDCLRLGAAAVLRVQGDVSQAAVLKRAAKQAQRHWGGLDIVYANAGYSQSGRLESLSLAQWRRQMAVNVEGVLHTVQASLPLLSASQGRLGLIGSVVGYGSLAGSGAYAASKASLRAMAQVLDLELQGSGISVTYAAPGFFASEIRLKDADGRPDPQAPEYIPAWMLGETDRVAAGIAAAVRWRCREVILPKHAKLAAFFLRHAPGLSQALARRLSLWRERRQQAARALKGKP